MARMKQLDERGLEEARAAETLKRSRLGNKAYFDSHRRMRTLHQKIEVGDLVLLHNTRIRKSWDKKLDSNWLGPYTVHEISESGYYRLAELDSANLTEFVAGNRLKKFFLRAGEGVLNAAEGVEDEIDVSRDSGVIENGTDLDEYPSDGRSETWKLMPTVSQR